MILFLGLLSLVQITFLPGFLILRCFSNKHFGFFEKLTFSFALSLVFNYTLVLVLTTLGIYSRLLVFALFLAELVLAIWLYRGSLALGIQNATRPIIDGLQTYIGQLTRPRDKSEQDWQRSLRLFLFALLFLGALSALAWITRTLWDNRFTVFSVWDSVVSWNKWATQWFSNQLPDLPRRYGQLIPANWSLSYTFIGSDQVQFFAKGIMPLFTLGALILPVLLGIEFKSYGYFAAAILIQLLYKKFLGEHVSSGYVDSAVAFFSIASIYCLLKASLLKHRESIIAFLALGAILAGGAFATKQPGLYILVTYPFLAYFIVVRGNKLLKGGDLKKAVFYPIAIALAFSIPWYIYAEVTIYLGLNKSEFEWILDEVHRGRSLWERFTLALSSLEVYAILFVVFVVSMPFLPRALRWIALVIILPYSLLWALYASYSQRNLALVFPILAMVSGVGFENIIDWLQGHLRRIRFGKAPLFLGAIGLAVLGLSATLLIPDSRLVDIQVTQQREILLRGVNRDLYEYFEDTGEYGVVLSGYPLEFLPGFEELTVSDSFEEYETYIEHRQQHPEILYLLMPKAADDRIFNEVMDYINAGIYELIFEQNNYFFIKIGP
ncbi:MAG: hypothetical protein WD751_11965 [Anaerolineales bacterium]